MHSFLQGFGEFSGTPSGPQVRIFGVLDILPQLLHITDMNVASLIGSGVIPACVSRHHLNSDSLSLQICSAELAITLFGYRDA